MDKSTMNMCVRVLFEHMFSIILYMYLGVKSVDNMLNKKTGQKRHLLYDSIISYKYEGSLKRIQS